MIGKKAGVSRHIPLRNPNRDGTIAAYVRYPEIRRGRRKVLDLFRELFGSKPTDVFAANPADRATPFPGTHFYKKVVQIM